MSIYINTTWYLRTQKRLFEKQRSWHDYNLRSVTATASCNTGTLQVFQQEFVNNTEQTSLQHIPPDLSPGYNIRVILRFRIKIIFYHKHSTGQAKTLRQNNRKRMQKRVTD